MKKLIALIFFCAMGFFFSCKKVLDTVPQDIITPEYYYDTEAQLNNALTAVYDVLGSANGNMGDAFDSADQMFLNNGTTFGKLDIMLYASTDPVPTASWQNIYKGVERANMLLANIDKATMEVEANRGIIKGQAQFLRAYFYFMLVGQWGSVPLKIKPTASVTDVNIARTPANEIYDFIIKEMTEAEALVPDITTYNFAGRVTKSAVQGVLARVCLYKAGFPNNDVAKFADALKWANKVIASGIHSLDPDYSQEFINLIQNKYNIKESIFEIEYNTTGATDVYGEGGGPGVTVGTSQNLLEVGYVVGSYGIHLDYYNKFDEKDLRRDWLIQNYQYSTAGVSGNGPGRVYYTPTDNIYLRKPGLWRREYELVVNKQKNITGTNWPVLRYSDVLLMAAEADNELNGPNSTNVGYVNMIRRRAYGNGQTVKSVAVTNGGSGYTTVPTITIAGGGSVNTGGIDPTSAVATISGGKVTAITMKSYGTFFPSGAPTVTISGGGGTGATATATLLPANEADLPSAQTASKDAFRKAIQDERSRELGFQALRRLDLIRWGIYIPTLRALAAYALTTAPANRLYAANPGLWVTEKNYYVPIPGRELSLNRMLVQTPGW